MGDFSGFDIHAWTVHFFDPCLAACSAAGLQRAGSSSYPSGSVQHCSVQQVAEHLHMERMQLCCSIWPELLRFQLQGQRDFGIGSMEGKRCMWIAAGKPSAAGTAQLAA